MTVTNRDQSSRTRIYQDVIHPGENWHIYEATANLLGQAKRRDYSHFAYTGIGPRLSNKARKDRLQAEYNIGHDWANNIVQENNDQHALLWRTHRANRKEWHSRVKQAKNKPKNAKLQRQAITAQANLDRTAKGPSITHGGNTLWKRAQNDERLMEVFKERRWFAKSLGDKGRHKTNRLIRISEKGEVSIMVPPALRDGYGLTPRTARVVIATIQYRHGWDNILDAIQNDRAVTYRFIRREKHWLLQATVSLSETERIEAKHVLAIDTNSGHLDACVLDKYGNPRAFITLSVKEKRLSETLDRLLKWAARWGIDHVVMEQLRNAQKRWARGSGGKKNKVTSSIPTGQLRRQLGVLCENNGWSFSEVNPAHTSQNTDQWEDVCHRASSSHQIASYLIGRRGLGLTIYRATGRGEGSVDSGLLVLDVFSDDDGWGLSEDADDSEVGERHSRVLLDEMPPF